MELASLVGNLPNDADKVLFAEDVVSYLMLHSFNVPYSATTASPYRDFIHNAFNGTVKAAVSYICNRTQTVNATNLKWIDELRVSDRNVLLKIFKRLHSNYFSKGYDAKHFLHYCVDLTLLAYKFKNHGLEEAPDLAVSHIRDSLKDYDMLSHGWNSLNIVAIRYASLPADCNIVLTPSSLPSTSSEGECRNMIHEISNLNKGDEKPPKNEENKKVPEEEKHETKIQVIDLKDPMVVREKKDDENLQMCCASSQDEHLQSVETPEKCRLRVNIENSCTPMESKGMSKESLSAHQLPSLSLVSAPLDVKSMRQNYLTDTSLETKSNTQASGEKRSSTSYCKIDTEKKRRSSSTKDLTDIINKIVLSGFPNGNA